MSDIPKLNNTSDKDSVVAKRNSFYLFLFIIGWALSFYLIYHIFSEKEKEKQIRIAQELYQRQRSSIVADSIAEVKKQRAIYYSMIDFIQSRDSVRKTLRYKIGDVVFLKPDSIRCVIMDVSSDSTMNAFSYVMISNNKNNDPGIIIRNDKLIY